MGLAASASCSSERSRQSITRAGSCESTRTAQKSLTQVAIDFGFSEISRSPEFMETWKPAMRLDMQEPAPLSRSLALMRNCASFGQTGAEKVFSERVSSVAKRDQLEPHSITAARGMLWS